VGVTGADQPKQPTISNRADKPARKENEQNRPERKREEKASSETKVPFRARGPEKARNKEINDQGQNQWGIKH
jgi:hypothetical protein